MSEVVKLTKAQMAMLVRASEPMGDVIFGDREAGVANRLKGMGLICAVHGDGAIYGWVMTRIAATDAGRAALEPSP